MSAPLLEVSGARVTIGEATILKDASLTVDAGRLVAVVGPNGAGKSTLARAAAGLQPLTSGSVRWSGEDIGSLRGRRLARRRAFIPQRARVPGGLRVADAVAIGRSPHVGAFHRPTSADREAVARAIVRAGVGDLAQRQLTTLSGGELQRVQIAVALAQDAPALIADEPTSHLDLGAAASVARLLRGLADDGLAVVLVVHDLALAAAIADEVVVISHGRSVAGGPAAEVLERERLADVWRIDAQLETSPGRTALHVAWLGEPTTQMENR